jgi:hypothetical protein
LQLIALSLRAELNHWIDTFALRLAKTLSAATAGIAAYALVFDDKDELAAGFYVHHGFIPLPEQPLCLFLPLATVKSLTDWRI